MSLKEFIRQQETEPQEPECQNTVVVTVLDFIDAIQDAYEDDWTAEVTCDYPEPGGFLLKITPPDDTEQ